MSPSLDYLIKHIDKCPLLTRENGKLFRRKDVSDQEIAQWFGKLSLLNKKVKEVELSLLDVRSRQLLNPRTRTM